MRAPPERKPINLTDSVFDVLVAMTDGNIGAAKVLSKMLSHDPDKGMICLFHLDDMNMRGSQVWVAFKEYAHSDMDLFMTAIKDHSPAMVAKVNALCSCLGHMARERAP